MRGQTIKIYIMGETSKNLKTAELGNWTGKAYIGQRKHIGILQSIEELRSPGIYILISEIEDSYQKRIYIGEADEINTRLSEQFRNKDWWNEFVAFISKDSNLTKAHVRYLEKQLHEIALKNNTTLQLSNGNTPPGSKLPVSDCDDMNTFAENIIFVLKNLGIVDFTKTEIVLSKSDNTQSDVFYINIPGAKGEQSQKAQLIIVDAIYKLLEGSYIRKEDAHSSPSHNYFKLRTQLANEGYFENTNNELFYRLSKDIEFNSPSAAAAVVRNSSINGRKEWKLNNGMTLDDYENSK